MNSIGKVIFDALAARRKVVLPEVGSLQVKRRKAKKISETQIIPPQNVVVFTPEELEGALSAVDLLVSEAKLPVEDARSLYSSWLEDARSDYGIAIDGVGEIKEGKFIAAEVLRTALNPAGEENVVTVEKERRKSPLWAWLLGGILLAVLVLVAIWCWQKGCFECRKDRQPATVGAVATPEPEPVQAGGDVAADAAEAAPVSTAISTPVTVPAAGSATVHGFHVIAGSFSIEGNADSFIKKLRRDHPELTVSKVVNPRNGYHMVSIFSAPTERQAYNKMNMYWDINLHLWVYEQK